MQLMQKFAASQATTSPLQIKSVILPKKANRFIFIEADERAYVYTAIADVDSLDYGIMKMVSGQYMDKLLRENIFKPNSFVRVKSQCKDIGQVISVDIAQQKATVKLVPRIDYSRLRGILRTKESEEIFKKKGRNSRPAPAKLFDLEAVRNSGGVLDAEDEDFYTFERNRYSRRDGLVYTSFPMADLIPYVNPTPAQLEVFPDEECYTPDSGTITPTPSTDGSLSPDESGAWDTALSNTPPEGSLSFQDWHTTGIEVSFKESSTDPGLYGQVCDLVS